MSACDTWIKKMKITSQLSRRKLFIKGKMSGLFINDMLLKQDLAGITEFIQSSIKHHHFFVLTAYTGWNKRQKRTKKNETFAMILI